MSKESRIGIFAIIVLAVAIWGYKYLKGKNLLSKSYTFYSVYNDVNQLTISSPVLFNGLTVGSVVDIKINDKNLSEMVVTYSIEKDYRIPKNAIAYQMSNGVINGKAISIRYDKVCTGADCAESGDFLEGRNLGMISSLLGTEEIDKYIGEVTDGLNGVVTKIGAEDSEGAINETIRQLEQSMTNINSISQTTDALLKSSYRNLDKTISNMSTITSNLAASNAQITAMLNNLTAITSDIKSANIGKTITTSNATLAEAELAVTDLRATLASTDEMIKGLQEVVAKVDGGEGTLGQLINDKELYTNLETTSKNLSLLLQDLRLNPKRYVNVSIFGKKDKEYVVPEADPAFIDQN